MAYPASLSTFSGTTAQGTSTLSSPDHALDHRNLGSAVGTLEQVIGTNSGTAILKNFTVGKFALSDNGGTLTNGVIGTATIGSPTLTGGTLAGQIKNNGTITAGYYGTATFGSPTTVGGTTTGGVINGGTLGTPVIGTISIPGTVTALGFSAAITPAVGTFNDGTAGTVAGTRTANAQAAQVYYSVIGTAAGDRNIGTPLNPTGYQGLTYAFKTSGSANGTLVWPTGAFSFSQDVGTPTLGTGTLWHYYAWRYNVITSKWEFQGQSKNVG